ncbi:MAG: VTT domain-containing protein [Ferruginibacter sp.]|nr:VTT domain-containing protein [Ferruginibacter sp.]
MKQERKNIGNNTDKSFFKKYVVQKIFWTILALFLVVVINILINKYAGGYFNDIAERVSHNYTITGVAFFLSEILIGIFPAELFMMIYQSKSLDEYFLIVLILGIISSLCGFIAFLAGRYLNAAKISRMVVLQKKFKKYGDMFLKYGWVIIILAATTPLPFAMISFIAGYFKFSPATFLKIVVPVRIVRFFISAYFIKYSINLL